MYMTKPTLSFLSVELDRPKFMLSSSKRGPIYIGLLNRMYFTGFDYCCKISLNYRILQCCKTIVVVGKSHGLFSLLDTVEVGIVFFLQNM